LRTLTRHSRFALLAVIAAALLWPADLFAQRAVRRTPGRRSVVVVGGPYYSPYYYYRPYYYGGFYGAYYSPFFWSAYGQYPYPYPYYGPWAYDNTGSARLQVTPRNTRVYVDGYFVGLVDDFDGNLQRLNVEAGEHEIQLHLDGHRTFTQKVLLVRGRTLKIVHVMQPLGPGEAPQPVPTPDESLRAQPYKDPQPRQGPPPRPGQQAQFGSLLLRVRPADAEILVDGESWDAPQGEEQFVIELGEGPHRIEVRKNGFQTYSTTVRVRRGETVRLNVSLTAGGVLTSVL
jgi:PEGA domain